MGWLYVMNFSVIFAMLLATTYAEKALTSTESVRYMKNSKFNFFMAPGKAVKESRAMHVFTKNVTYCTCKAACRVVSCMSWSVAPLGNGIHECRLDAKGPLNRTQEDNPASVLFFREDSIPGEYLQQEDGLLYVKLKRIRTHEEGKFLCSSIPGHRLVILKTKKQLDFLQAWSQKREMMVDLTQSSSSSDIIWGDGTRYEDTELDSSILSAYPEGASDVIYVFKDGKLEASDPDDTARIICQVDLFVD